MLTNTTPLTSNRGLLDWVQDKAALFQAESIHWCDGSETEYQALCGLMVRGGTALRLNPQKRFNSILVRTDARDVARVEERTFICSRSPHDAGPTNNWRDPFAMKALLGRLFDGAMRGRTLFVVPFLMGPPGSPLARVGVQLTDSPYVAASMKIMTRMGQVALDALGDEDFVPCLHSVGYPLLPGEEDVPWPCDPERIVVAHFPEERQIWSYGSGYGGNALLGKKCLALRIAGVMAREEGWLAEHMLILGLSNPAGEKIYLAAAFPSACGKTNLAMLKSALPGWKVECVGDDIAWMRFGNDDRLYALNPEAGFFGVAPGTSWRSNPHAMEMLRANTIFTNTALTPDGDVWWEGMTEGPPDKLVDWTGQEWTPDCGRRAAHPNARFTTPARQCPVIDPAWEDPRGVPIAAILFGGRRAATVPLVYEAFDWAHGTFVGATMASETTAASSGEAGRLRRDPFAMLPFCGYHMGDFFADWLHVGHLLPAASLPRVYAVNWFRKGEDDNFLWPGFGENVRVLKWIFERVADDGNGADAAQAGVAQPGAAQAGVAQPSAIGNLPAPGALDVAGLDLPAENLRQLFAVNPGEWQHEAQDILDFYEMFDDRLPDELHDELESLLARMKPSLQMV